MCGICWQISVTTGTDGALGALLVVLSAAKHQMTPVSVEVPSKLRGNQTRFSVRKHNLATCHRLFRGRTRVFPLCQGNIRAWKREILETCFHPAAQTHHEHV